jgi:hypothetical protein
MVKEGRPREMSTCTWTTAPSSPMTATQHIGRRVVLCVSRLIRLFGLDRSEDKAPQGAEPRGDADP